MKNNYLERIAIALETLVSQGNYLSAEVEQAKSAEVEQVITSTPEPTKEAVKPVAVEYADPTHDDLKQACLTSARADSKNRDKLKALLKEYGATKAVDVEPRQIAEVIARINKGEF